MKKRIASVLTVTILLTVLLSGCKGKIKYEGVDYSGNDAADIVREYYDLIKEDKQKEQASLFTDAYNERKENIVWQDISLVKLTHCEVVDEADIRESDKAWIEEISRENYAYCFVQTSDVILCEEDGAQGAKGETVSRNYYYALLMETKGSDWKIEDFGYPPFYVYEEK